jgi:hypothetical protein
MWLAADGSLPPGIRKRADAQGVQTMMLAIAFLMFAVLVAGWLFAPDGGRDEAPETTTSMVPEAAPSNA